MKSSDSDYTHHSSKSKRKKKYSHRSRSSSSSRSSEDNNDSGGRKRYRIYESEKPTPAESVKNQYLCLLEKDQKFTADRMSSSSKEHKSRRRDNNNKSKKGDNKYFFDAEYPRSMDYYRYDDDEKLTKEMILRANYNDELDWKSSSKDGGGLRRTNKDKRIKSPKKTHHRYSNNSSAADRYSKESSSKDRSSETNKDRRESGTAKKKQHSRRREEYSRASSSSSGSSSSSSPGNNSEASAEQRRQNDKSIMKERKLKENVKSVDDHLKSALRNAMATDVLLKSGKTTTTLPMAEDDRVKRSQRIEEIESSDFRQKSFKSSRGEIPLPEGLEIDAKHSAAIFGRSRVDSLAKPFFKAPTDADSRLLALMHPSLFLDQKTKMDVWKKKLSELQEEEIKTAGEKSL